jgi:protein TonB
MSEAVRATPAGSAPLSARRDALAAILGDGERWDLISVCLAIAFSLHAAMLVFAIVAGLLKDLRLAVEDNRSRLHDFFWRQYDVEVEKPKEQPKPEEPPPPPPEPEPAPVPQPKAAAQKQQDDDPYKNLPPPAPAQAGKVLTQKEDPDDVKDLTGNTVVSGEGSATYGMQSGQGKGDAPTMAKNATNAGVPGGTGTGTAAPAAAPAPTVDRSRGIALPGGVTSWKCPFPPEAEAEQIESATVVVQITVRPDGTAISASVISDPGHGFGRQARICALSKRYEPALDKTGNPITSSAPIKILFTK